VTGSTCSAPRHAGSIRQAGARAEAFVYKERSWLESLPPAASGVMHAGVRQFGGGGTEALETPTIIQLPAVIAAGDPRRMVSEEA
jgi:hypothetical protein